MLNLDRYGKQISGCPRSIGRKEVLNKWSSGDFFKWWNYSVWYYHDGYITVFVKICGTLKDKEWNNVHS